MQPKIKVTKNRNPTHNGFARNHSHKTLPSPSSHRRLVVTAAIKQNRGKKIMASKTLIAKPGQESKVEQLCRQISDYSKQRMAEDRSAGILAFEFSLDSYDSNTFHFMELYDSNAQLGRHNTTDEFVTFMKEVNTYLEQPVGMCLYEWDDGKIGLASRVQGGPKGEGGLDDAPGASGLSGGASLKQTSGAVDLTNIKGEDAEERGLWGIKLKLPWLSKKK